MVCPFCGDTRGKMNFVLHKDGKPANTYHCFDCGAGGNMLTLYADLKGIYGADRYKIAYREIMDALGKTPSRKGSVISEYQVPVPMKEETRASLTQRDQVYRKLLELLTLSALHEQELLNRGLTKQQIEVYQFRSTPTNGTESLTRKLIREGYSLAGIPGFFVNGRRDWDMAFYRKNRGFLCPAYSIDGKIEGFQIRLDEPYGDRKYLWFSSINKPHGTGSKSPVTFLGDPHGKVVRVTEGILKPMVAHALSGRSFLGRPGVSQYKELEKALIILKQNGLEEVQECDDMDKLLDTTCHADYKPEACKDCRYQMEKEGVFVCLRKEEKRARIRDGCCRVYEICKKLNLRCTRKIWDTNEEGLWAGNDKGIDDYWWNCQKKRKEMDLWNEFYGRVSA